MPETVQQHQPDGVPPLELTGERTLPDVPAENYWFRRHLAVYEWVAERVAGLDVVDMACGEGYGTEVLAGRARRARTQVGHFAAHHHGDDRIRGDVRRHARPNRFAIAQHREMIGDPADLLEKMGDVHDGVTFIAQGIDELEQAMHVGLREAAGRFIEDQDA